jgi:hypothetical protein
MIHTNIALWKLLPISLIFSFPWYFHQIMHRVKNIFSLGWQWVPELLMECWWVVVILTGCWCVHVLLLNRCLVVLVFFFVIRGIGVHLSLGSLLIRTRRRVNPCEVWLIKRRTGIIDFCGWWLWYWWIFGSLNYVWVI